MNGVTISSCFIDNNGGNGINLATTARDLIIQNTISNNGGWGLTSTLTNADHVIVGNIGDSNSSGNWNWPANSEIGHNIDT